VHQSKLGIYFQAYLNNKQFIKDGDILFCVQDGTSLGILFFKLIGAINNKTIIMIQGLHDRFAHFKRNKFLIYLFHNLLLKANLILTLSEYERNLLIKQFNLNKEKVKVFYFGVDTSYWKPQTTLPLKEPSKEFILSVGNDMHRDYDLLLNHYNLKIPLKLITRILSQRQLKKVASNTFLENYQQIDNQKLLNLYRQTKFAIIPLSTTYATSGLSTALQFMAMKKAVLIADAPALRELFQDYYHVLYYQTGNPISFTNKLQELNSNSKLREKLGENGRSLVIQKFNSKNMGKNISLAVKSLIQS
jgi:glycosyltransferase involved in cell wall biosynthesis